MAGSRWCEGRLDACMLYTLDGANGRDVSSPSCAGREAKIQGRGQGQFLLETVREGLFQASLPGLELPSAPCVFTSSLLCACVCLEMSPFYKDTSPIG